MGEAWRGRVEALLAHAIEANWPGAKLAAIDEVPGDASSREYKRCSLDAGSSSAPARVIAMLAEDAGTAMSSDELGVFGEDGPKESPFVNVARELARHTDAAPAIYYTNSDFTEMVLEDVGDVPLWDAAGGSADGPAGLFGDALALLAELQVRCVDNGSGCYAFAQSFDERLFLWEFEHFLEFGVEPTAPADLISACRRELTDAATRLGAMDRVFCHRDYHAWNIHVQDGRIRLIDFQDALLAPRFYDVASLLTDRITPQLITEPLQTELVARYCRELAARGVEGYDASRAREEFGLCALQRALKVVGRFNFLADVKAKPHYRHYLPDVTATALSASGATPGFAATHQVLEKHAKSEA